MAVYAEKPLQNKTKASVCEYNCVRNIGFTSVCLLQRML